MKEEKKTVSTSVYTCEKCGAQFADTIIRDAKIKSMIHESEHNKTSEFEPTPGAQLTMHAAKTYDPRPTVLSMLIEALNKQNKTVKDIKTVATYTPGNFMDVREFLVKAGTWFTISTSIWVNGDSWYMEHHANDNINAGFWKFVTVSRYATLYDKLKEFLAEKGADILHMRNMTVSEFPVSNDKDITQLKDHSPGKPIARLRLCGMSGWVLNCPRVPVDWQSSKVHSWAIFTDNPKPKLHEHINKALAHVFPNTDPVFGEINRITIDDIELDIPEFNIMKYELPFDTFIEEIKFHGYDWCLVRKMNSYDSFNTTTINWYFIDHNTPNGRTTMEFQINEKEKTND